MNKLIFCKDKPNVKTISFYKSTGTGNSNVLSNNNTDILKTTNDNSNKEVLVAIQKQDRLERIVLWVSLIAATAQISLLLMHIFPRVDNKLIVK